MDNPKLKLHEHFLHVLITSDQPLGIWDCITLFMKHSLSISFFPLRITVLTWFWNRILFIKPFNNALYSTVISFIDLVRSTKYFFGEKRGLSKKIYKWHSIEVFPNINTALLYRNWILKCPRGELGDCLLLADNFSTTISTAWNYLRFKEFESYIVKKSTLFHSFPSSR